MSHGDLSVIRAADPGDPERPIRLRAAHRRAERLRQRREPERTPVEIRLARCRTTCTARRPDGLRRETVIGGRPVEVRDPVMPADAYTLSYRPPATSSYARYRWAARHEHLGAAHQADGGEYSGDDPRRVVHINFLIEGFRARDEAVTRPVTCPNPGSGETWVTPRHVTGVRAASSRE
ncbi:hypothetical protein JCM4814A_81880 [Streptomyces phaeofaciens JCM 4814]|uniref:Uncharacterized protein n=1 Tax=Streptomyces phaeofaciens TaxID=68254 RepID=A0A918M0N6_9ACTN|nr:hypothetical protein GCM10010226_79900 [Streptomyces phaeofaciens]